MPSRMVDTGLGRPLRGTGGEQEGRKWAQVSGVTCKALRTTGDCAGNGSTELSERAPPPLAPSPTPSHLCLSGQTGELVPASGLPAPSVRLLFSSLLSYSPGCQWPQGPSPQYRWPRFIESTNHSPVSHGLCNLHASWRTAARETGLKRKAQSLRLSKCCPPKCVPLPEWQGPSGAPLAPRSCFYTLGSSHRPAYAGFCPSWPQLQALYFYTVPEAQRSLASATVCSAVFENRGPGNRVGRIQERQAQLQTHS